MSKTDVKDDNDTQSLLQDSSTTSEQSGMTRQYETNKGYQSTTASASLLGVVSKGSIESLSETILKWRDIGRKLEISDEDLDRIQSDTTGGHKEKVYQMLKKWKQQKGRNATYKRLGEALMKCGRTDLQQQLEQEAKAFSRRSTVPTSQSAKALSKRSTVPTNQSDYTNEAGGEKLQFNGMLKKKILNYIIIVSCVVLVACALILTVFLVIWASTTADRNPAITNTTPSTTSMASITADSNPAITNTTPSTKFMVSTTADRNPAITNTTPSTKFMVSTTADKNPAITNTTPSTTYMGTTTKLQTSKKYPYYINIQVYADEPGRHNLILGSNSPGDFVLYRSRHKVHGTLFEVTQYTFQYSKKPTETISGVLVRDNWDDDTGGYPELMAGGPGKGYVVVKISSQGSRGFDFSFSVYGRNT